MFFCCCKYTDVITILDGQTGTKCCLILRSFQPELIWQYFFEKKKLELIRRILCKILPWNDNNNLITALVIWLFSNDTISLLVVYFVFSLKKCIWLLHENVVHQASHTVVLFGMWFTFLSYSLGQHIIFWYLHVWLATYFVNATETLKNYVVGMAQWLHKLVTLPWRNTGPS